MSLTEDPLLIIMFFLALLLYLGSVKSNQQLHVLYWSWITYSRSYHIKKVWLWWLILTCRYGCSCWYSNSKPLSIAIVRVPSILNTMKSSMNTQSKSKSLSFVQHHLWQEIIALHSLSFADQLAFFTKLFTAAKSQKLLENFSMCGFSNHELDMYHM